MKGLTKSNLAIIASKMTLFERPNVSLEQYPTDSEIAADSMWNALMLGDIEGKDIVDLGCGTGMLGVCCLMLGAKNVSFVDIDGSAINIAKDNIKTAKSECGFAGKPSYTIGDVKDSTLRTLKADTVVQNPPFGTKVKHADKDFLQKAFTAAPVIYSFHTTESESFVKKLSESNGFKVSHTWRYEFPLKSTMRFHKTRIKRIKVSVLRLVKE